MLTWYVSALFLLGLAMTVFGTLMPLGGGSAVAAIGAAAIGAGLVLVGIRMMPRERRSGE